MTKRRAARERVIDLNAPALGEVPPPTAAEEAVEIAQAVETAVRNDQLDHMARVVRHCYMQVARAFKGEPLYGRALIPAWDGGTDRFGKHHRSCWPTLARHIAEQGADPLLYIRAQFCAADRSRIPAPNTMYSTLARGRYLAWIADRPQELRRVWDAALASLTGEMQPMMSRLQWDYATALRSALNNIVTVQASPLFRYCTAMNEGHEDLAAIFHDRALLDYAFQQPLYDHAWGRRVPEVLQQEGTALRTALLNL